MGKWARGLASNAQEGKETKEESYVTEEPYRNTLGENFMARKKVCFKHVCSLLEGRDV